MVQTYNKHITSFIAQNDSVYDVPNLNIPFPVKKIRMVYAQITFGSSPGLASRPLTLWSNTLCPGQFIGIIVNNAGTDFTYSDSISITFKDPIIISGAHSFFCTTSAQNNPIAVGTSGGNTLNLNMEFSSE